MNTQEAPLVKFDESWDVEAFIEALADNTRYITPEVIEYAVREAEAAKKEGRLSQMDKYSRMASKEPDARLSLYYEYRMMLSPQAAENMVREYYQKTVRNGVGSLDVNIGTDAGSEDLLNFASPFGNAYADVGIFSALGQSKRSEPLKAIEIGEFIDKLVNHHMLTRNGRIVLITRLLTDATAGAGRGQSIDKTNGLDLASIMSKLPPEYDMVVNQLMKLRKFGLDDSEITATTILRGFKKPGGATAPSVPPLVPRDKITSAGEEAQDVLIDLTGKSEMGDIKKFLMGMNESIQNVPTLLGAAQNVLGEFEERRGDALRADTMARVVTALMRGGRIKRSSLIKAIVFAVAENMRNSTPLSRSRLFTGNLRDVAKRYMAFASGRKMVEKNVIQLQNLLIAPMLHAKGNKFIPLRKKL